MVFGGVEAFVGLRATFLSPAPLTGSPPPNNRPLGPWASCVWLGQVGWESGNASPPVLSRLGPSRALTTYVCGDTPRVVRLDQLPFPLQNHLCTEYIEQGIWPPTVHTTTNIRPAPHLVVQFSQSGPIDLLGLFSSTRQHRGRSWAAGSKPN